MSNINVDIIERERPYDYDDESKGRFQPFRIVVRSGGNNKVLFRSSEAYTNEADAENAAIIAFGAATTVTLRRMGEPNRVLRRPAETDG